jgi:AraC family transcriptional regulator, exoenzyme S synthesis regulatory protein ExsA
MQDIVNLPDDITAVSPQTGDKIIFHHYMGPAVSFRGKSILNKNAISLVVQGEKNMHFAGKSVNIRDDEFHFLSAGNCIVTMELNATKPFESVLLFFEDSILGDFYSKYDQKITAIKKRTRITEELYVAFRKDEFVKNFINSVKLLLQKETISPAMKQLKFEELMLHLLETCPEQLLAFPLSKNIDLSDLEIRKAMELNVTKNITIEELAFICNMSLSTFKRRFAKLYDTTPNKWIFQKRMELARELLVRYGERPGEIFHKLGYENHSSFSQSFRQHFGTTPREFQMHELNQQQQVLNELP